MRILERSLRGLCATLPAALLGAMSAPASAQSGAGQTVGLEEIIVTARKREESLQEVPISINVLAGEFLQNARLADVRDLLIRVPGIGFGQPFKSYTPIAIRGASTQDDSIGVDPNVAVFVDGVNVGSTTSIEFDLLDLERVEVLKGPQGTTFGRNTNGGVIHYITRNPSQEFRASTSVTLGNHDRIEATAYVSGGLTSTVSGSLAGRTRNSGGYVRNLSTGNMLGQDKVSSLRGKLLFAPQEGLEVLFSGDWMVDNSYGTPRYFEGPRPDTLPAGTPFANNLKAVAQDLDGSYDRVGGGGSVTIKYDTGIGRLHSISAYRKFNGKLYNFDFDAVDARTTDGRDSTEAFMFQNTTLRSISQELRLDWAVGELADVTTGVYYLDEKQYRIEQLAASGVIGSSWRGFNNGADLPRDILDQTMKTKSLGLFTDARIHLGERATLSAGFRWTRDEKDGTTQCHQVGAFFCADVYRTSYGESWSEPSWRAAFDYRMTDDLMGYVSVTRGYKSGGFSNSASGDGTAAEVAPLLATPYRPEFSTSYEAGLRMQFADRRLTVNPTVFYVKYKDVQFLFLQQNSNSFISGNIGAAKNKGIEVDVNVQATDELSLWASYSYQDSEYTAGASFGVPILGNQLQLTPKHSFTAGFDYTKQLSNGDGVSFSGDIVQKSRQYDDATNDPIASTKFQELVNMRLAYRRGEHAEVALWVNNLFDKRNALGTNQLGFFIYSDAQGETPAALAATQRTYSTPRMYGVTFKWTF